MKKFFGIMVCLACLLKSDILAFSLIPENFSFLGVGQSRWTQGNDAAPYHAANVMDIFGTYQTSSKNLQIDARVTLENPSVSHEYLEKQRAYARITVTYQKELANHEILMLKSGNLGEITIGRGLTLKDMESMGFSLGWTTPAFSTSLTYIGRGYSQYGDYAIVDIHPTKIDSFNMGAYYFLMIPETKNQYVSRIISGYADVSIGGVTINFETATNLAKAPIDGPRLAALIRPYYKSSNVESRFFMSATARYHSAAFNSTFNDYPPDKNFHALDEEDEEVDNWRNVLVYTGSQYQPSDMVGISLHLKYDRDLGNHWWAYSDIEWLKQHYNYTDRSNLFYKIGVQYEWEANQLVYAGIQNKLFSTTFQETYKNFDPLFMEVSPFLVMGLKYRF